MQILVRLARRSVVSPVISDEIIAILQQQYFNEGIPALLPADVNVAHKTGWIGKVYHDAPSCTHRSIPLMLWSS